MSDAVGNVRIMRTLMRKDWRFFRGPMIGLICMGIAPYPIILVIEIQIKEPVNWGAAAAIGMVLTTLLASVFGGAAIAAERQNRTADFLDLLPVTRGQIVLSKWIVSYLILVLCMLPHLVVAALYAGSELYFERNWVEGFGPSIATFSGLFVGFFGVAWLIGSFSHSAAISAAVSIAITIGAFATLAACMNGTSRDRHHIPVEYWLAALPFAMGVVSLIGGTIHYLRRVEP